MYVVAAILYLIPAAMIVAGWLRRRKARHLPAAGGPWRDKCVMASLIVVSCATLAGFASTFNWLSLGGDLHGMGSTPGPWQPLERCFIALLTLGVVLALLDKGKGRFLAIGAALAAFFADVEVVLLQMD